MSMYPVHHLDDSKVHNGGSLQAVGPTARVVVGALDCGSEGCGFSIISHVILSPDWPQTRARSAVGQTGSWDHTAELHPFQGCVAEGVALIT